MGILVFDDPRKYIGMHVVYFDGTVDARLWLNTSDYIDVQGARIIGVKETWEQTADGGINMTRLFMLEYDNSKYRINNVPEEKLYMNWNSWMRTMLFSGLGPDNETKEREFTLFKVNNVFFQTCRNLYELVKSACSKEATVDSIDWMIGMVEPYVTELSALLKEWKVSIKPDLDKGFAQSWTPTLVRLIRKRARREASRQARRKWRQEHDIH